jgi:hypothetical protein
MLSNENHGLRNIFRNPFEDINANVIEPKQIVDFWCSPFNRGILANLDEHKFCSSKMPIILQGSRGSGKTTILKYFSFPVQKIRAELSTGKAILKLLEDDGAVGFYYRCDDSFISNFKCIFENVNRDEWTLYFENYIELLFCKNILDMLITLEENGEFVNTNGNKIIFDICEKYGLKEYIKEASFNDFYTFICEQVKYIDIYKNQSIFTDAIFEPHAVFSMFTISNDIINALKTNYKEFSDILFVMMFDEFENLSDDIQKRFNTLIKFVKPNISLRIGRRSEGIATTETINKMEYLRENHDYFLASLDKEKDIKLLREYFREVSEKRLNYVNGNTLSLINMLGDMEDLMEECISTSNGRKLHLLYILKGIPALSSNQALCNEIIKIIQNDNNPIAETINALWVVRSGDDYIGTAMKAATTMRSYFQKCNEKDALVHKYANDYNNKYKYSITVYLCSVYKKEKLYYGFNAICHLSNGNTRTFINLCRSIISDAIFFENKKFFDTYQISKESQNRAIHSFSRAEFEDICSIIKHGNLIRNLVMNIGNIFSAYHKDNKLRYPETNQFVFSDLELYEQDKEVIKIAKSWSMIIKKERTQRLTASIAKKGDIHYINKIYSPIFDISYRTRGGVNPTFDKDSIHEMLYSLNIKDISIGEIKKKIKKQEKLEDDGQFSLFDMEGQNE